MNKLITLFILFSLIMVSFAVDLKGRWGFGIGGNDELLYPNLFSIYRGLTPKIVLSPFLDYEIRSWDENTKEKIFSTGFHLNYSILNGNFSNLYFVTGFSYGWYAWEDEEGKLTSKSLILPLGISFEYFLTKSLSIKVGSIGGLVYTLSEGKLKLRDALITTTWPSWELIFYY